MTQPAAAHFPVQHRRQALAYGALGLPLAFAALPLYSALPHHYASHLGLSLSTVGAMLLLVRLLDAGAEPFIGRFSNELHRRGVLGTMAAIVLAACVMLLGLVGLYFPQVQSEWGVALWLLAGLLMTSLAHSLMAIVHQAWGVRFGGNTAQRSRIVVWREGCGLLGVVLASVLLGLQAVPAMLLALAVALLLAFVALWCGPRPLPVMEDVPDKAARRALGTSLLEPLWRADFRRLLLVFACNGIASAIPAALLLFFAKDRLLAGDAHIAVFLALYFSSAALSLPAWLALVTRFGLERVWLAGMLLATACFAWTACLGAHQIWPFALICVLTGVGLGADLAAPGALLALLIERANAQGSQEGTYLGWWNLVAKLNLALAAGGALPLLQWLGYAPGSQNPVALQHLSWVYALLPCALKLLAAGLLWRFFLIHRSKE